LKTKELTISSQQRIISHFQAELWAVLNTLKEHKLQDAIKKWQKIWEWCICAEGDYFKSYYGQ
jgi:hypothetical protein